MEKNEELRIAWDFVENTGISIFLTGKAGTGKTTFLKAVRERCPKRMIVVAPTGVAAINAGGMTIHSFFQLSLSPFLPEARVKQRYDFSNDKKNIIRTLDLLVIDEISMVRSDLLDAVDNVMRRFRDPRKPFGGVQLLMIGDLQQLTPVVTPEDEAILHGHYDTPYFFGSKALQEIRYVTLELKHVYRQQDETFLEILNHIREGKPTARDLQCLNQRYMPDFHPNPEDGYIRLTTHNRLADSYNEQELQSLQAPVFSFHAAIDGSFPEYAYPTDVTLTLKKGAQVMFVKNDPSPEHLFYNGKIGHITDISSNSITVDGITVEPLVWENAKYELNEDTKEIETNVQGTFKQYPLRLAWAITIHKSQGLTFEHAIIDANWSFAAGQVYVALSRCKTLEGMILASPLKASAVMNDPRVAAYIAQEEEETARSIQALPTLKEQYHIEQLRELFDFSDIQRKESHLSRILDEHFYRTYPRIAAAHKEAQCDFSEKISEVARKWSTVFMKMNSKQLMDKAFLDRVNRSAVYFLNTLTDIIGQLLERTSVDTDNKNIRKRYEEALSDITMTYRTKVAILQQVATDGFTPTTYLSLKQKALLEAMDEKKPKARGKRQETKSRKQEAPPPVNTDDILNKTLYEQLRNWRWEKSRSQNLPPYTILQQKALIAISNAVPQDEQSLLALPYVGQKTVDTYGAEILAIVRRGSQQ